MPYLVVENGSQRGLKVEVPKGGTVTLGRDSKAEISVDDHLCSRRHFEVAEVDGRYFLRDLESSNGTYVNEVRVTEKDLQHGDCLQAGETQITFLDDAAAGGRGLIGKTVGGYRIVDRIGRGGMGTVYRANQVSLNRIVALKILSHKVAVDPAFVKRFQKEAQAAGRLNHPNIVQVYDVGSDGGLHFYSMEFIENGSVQDLATREGTLAVDLATSIILDAARGLEYAEKRGLVHRDIKPDNLMINAEGVVKIADLGLARDAGEAARESDALAGEHPKDDEGIFGTPHFIAPEQAQGRKVDTRSDIYSLGATFYRLLAGQTPFQGDSVREIIYKQINEEPRAIREINREVPAPVADIVAKMMRKNPDERFASAAELVETLVAVADLLEGKSGGSRKLVLALGAILVLGGGGAAYWFTGPGKPTPPPNETPEPDPGAKDAEARRLAEIERQAREVRAREERTKIKLDDVNLVGPARDVAQLAALLGRFRALADDAELKDTETAGLVRTEDVQRLETEIAKIRNAAAAEAARKEAAVAAASAKMAETAERADAFAKERKFGAAMVLVAGAKSSPAVLGYDRDGNLRALDARLASLAAAAAERAEAVVAAANAAVAKGEFDAAAGSCDGEAALFAEGAGEDAAAKEALAAATRLRTAATDARKARDAKRQADVAHDLGATFSLRRAVASLFAASFDPDRAASLLAETTAKLRSEEGRAGLALLGKDVDAAVRLRDALVQGATPEALRNATVKLPSAADPNRLVTYTLVEFGKASFTARIGQAEPKVFPYADHKPAALYELLMKPRLLAGPETARDAARLHLLAGAPEAALGFLDDLPAEDAEANELKTRAVRESKAKQVLVELRALERKAGADPKAWLEILPRCETLLGSYGDTLVVLLNSSGLPGAPATRGER